MTPRRRPGQSSHARRIVLSSDEEEADEEAAAVRDNANLSTSSGVRPRRLFDDDVIDLTLSSPESTSPKSQVFPLTKPTKPTGSVQKKRAMPISRHQSRSSPEPEAMIPLFRDDSDDEDSCEHQDDDDRSYDPFSVDDDDAILVL